MLNQIINTMILNPRKLFLIDGIGALVSAFSLGVVLVRFESAIGMPREVLYYLALPACLFAVYSLTCFFRLQKNWAPFLKVIAYTNLTYCLVQIGLVINHYEKLTKLGMTYFILELIIVAVLIAIELKTAKQLRS